MRTPNFILHLSSYLTTSEQTRYKFIKKLNYIRYNYSNNLQNIFAFPNWLIPLYFPLHRTPLALFLTKIKTHRTSPIHAKKQCEFREYRNATRRFEKRIIKFLSGTKRTPLHVPVSIQQTMITFDVVPRQINHIQSYLRVYERIPSLRAFVLPLMDVPVRVVSSNI